MNPSIEGKLERIAERFEEITALLSDPEIQNDQNRFRSLGQEYAQIEPVVVGYRRYQSLEEEIAGAEEMLADPEMAELARDELAEARRRQQEM